ncbi:MAG: hypothetical protein QME74_05550 [Candidatus Edwardsbacteria bacterium]|nr:hypothetical protein [Candidatus Edwardsbacteria bacterium]
MKRTSFLLLAFYATIAVSSAGEITVSPNPAVVKMSGTVQFTAAGATGAPGPVVWRVIPAGLGTIDAAGTFIASNRPGQGIVRAVIGSGDRETVGHAYVRVAAGAVQRLSVNVSPVRALVRTGATGEASPFAVRVFDANNTEIIGAEISWKVIPPDLGDIDQNGVFTARNPGAGRIVALAKTSDAKGLGQARVQVVTAERSQRFTVVISPKRARVPAGGTAAFTAAVSDPDGRPVEATLRYTVEPPSLGAIDAGGTFTAGDKPGTGIVRVVAASDKAIGSDRALVTVGERHKRYLVRLKPRQAALRAGESIQFTAEAFDQDGNQFVPPLWNWKVIPERLGTITPEGLFTAGDPPWRAMVGRITVRLPPVYGQGDDAAAIRIKPGLPNQVRVDPSKARVEPGKTQQFTATVTGPDGMPRQDIGISWKVYPPEIGAITPNGLFTAGLSSRLGAVIALVSPDLGGGGGFAGLSVSSYYVRIAGPRPHYLNHGEKYPFTAEVRDNGGNEVTGFVLEWGAKSAYPSFGSIDAVTGLFTAGYPLVSQVDGMVYVKARLNGCVIGGDGIKVIVHRQ